MSYEKIRKNSKGGQLIPKFLTPAGPLTPELQKRLQEMNNLMAQRGLSMEQSQQLYDAYNGDLSTINTMFDDGLSVDDMLNTGEVKDSAGNSVTVNLQEGVDYGSSAADRKNARSQLANAKLSKPYDQKKALNITNQAFGALGFESVNTELKFDADGNKVGMSEGAQMGMGIAAQAVQKTVLAVDGAVMGDKNFSAQSQAIDTAVHGVSGALMKSGNPYAMAAGAALEAINFATKAGGKNVQGYDVDINNSGYGNMGHMESEAGRVWDSWSGATARKLRKRNEQARMALAAADISQEQQYEQEARANSVTNVLQLNQIALAGGIDPSLLAG